MGFMQSGSLLIRRWKWRIAGAIAVAAAFVWARKWVVLAAEQLFLGMVTALMVLPLMKRLERRFSPGTAASLSLFLPGLALTAAVLLILPPLIRQGREWFSLLPSLLEDAGKLLQRGRTWLGETGLPIENMVMERVQTMAGEAAPAAVGWMRQTAGGIGRWMLAPLLAFYFLRDRKPIGRLLLSLLPVDRREGTVRMLREMRREVTGYLRGQLLISGFVAVLTAVGLLLCGVPSWMFLGLLIGMLELIPYIGPLIGGTLAALFALPMGWGRALWAVGAVVAVQQLDGSFLSPKLLSEATRLHPAAVILLITAGGAAAGMVGILLSVPLALCIRAALRTAMQSPVIREKQRL